MANVFVNEEILTNIANSIRSKTGIITTLKPSEMSNAIDNIVVNETQKVTLKVISACAITEDGFMTAFQQNLFSFNVNDVNSKYLKIDVSNITNASMRESGTSNKKVNVFAKVLCNKVYSSDGGTTTTQDQLIVIDKPSMPTEYIVVDLTEENLYSLYLSSSTLRETDADDTATSEKYFTLGEVGITLEFLDEV